MILIHGFGDTGDMWAKLAADLVRDHTVVVPDLRGMGLSNKPDGGYDKWTQAADMRGVLQALGRWTRRSSSDTTSGPWWPTPMPRGIATLPKNSW